MPTLGLSLLRQISVQVAQNPIQEVRALVPLEVGNFLLNQKRREILALEEQYHLRIMLTSSAGLSPEEVQLEFIKREAEEPKGEAADAKREAAEPRGEAAEPKAEPRKSRRSHRRGPRRGSRRGPKEGPQETQAPQEASAQEPPAAPASPAPAPEPDKEP